MLRMKWKLNSAMRAAYTALALPNRTSSSADTTPNLLDANPRLIYAAVTGFGLDGPYADRPALDIIVQAMSGLMSVTGDEGGAPVKVGVSIADLASGLYATIAVLAALAWILFLVVAVFAAVAFKSSKYWVFYSADKGGKNG